MSPEESAMTDAEKRTEETRLIVQEWCDSPLQVANSLPDDVCNSVLRIAGASARSFREVLLTICAATVRDPSYRATLEFYACNPRPLYEDGIRPVLEGLGIPCTQSGPLNIAKATVAIDSSWAAQRRPQWAAEDTLVVLSYLEGNVSKADEVAVELCRLLSAEAIDIDQMKSAVEGPERLDHLGDLCVRLIREATDGGNTAQRVCGYLLEESLVTSNLSVSGVTDSASTTNATSKKPGDLAVEDEEGKILRTFEVTTKGFTVQRISECSQSLRAFEAESGQTLPTVSVICERTNVPEIARKIDSGGFLGLVADGSINYEFVDIEAWIYQMLFNLADVQRLRFFVQLQNYVNEPNTRRDVKERFAVLAGDVDSNTAL